MKRKAVALLLTLLLSFGSVGCFDWQNFDWRELLPFLNSSQEPLESQTAKISSDVLDGKIANLLEAQGVGILDKTNDVVPVSASVSSKVLVAHADGGESVQKKAELAKKTETGVEDIHFHKPTDGAKNYKALNKKHGKHHHDKVECKESDCDKISDEVAQEEAEGKADTVLSLESRVNKLYTIGDFTFLSVSSAIEGYAHVETKKEANNSLFRDKQYWQSLGLDTIVNVEDNLVEGEGYIFSYIRFSAEKTGIIPIKTYEGEENYHKINYWSDDYNQSYIIDNKTGLTYSLSEFKYIYSVANGVIKVFDETSSGGFSYYIPKITEAGLTFEKVQLPAQDAEFENRVGSCRALADIYGNLVFSDDYGIRDESTEGIDEYGERKIGDKVIFAKKNAQIAQGLNERQKDIYSRSYRYFNGDDGRIYRVNVFGDINNLSVNVLDENCQWQEVEESANVEIVDGYICYQVGEQMRQDQLLITCIKDGEAYYSTAAYTDGCMIWPQAFFSNKKGFTGVVKMPTDKTKPNTVQDVINEFHSNGYPIENGRNDYSVYLVGKTQMLYFGNNEIILRDVKTGQERKIEKTLSQGDFGPYGDGKNSVTNVFVKGLGYLSLLDEVDFASFGAESFSATPILNETEFDEYYKFLKNDRARG